MAYSDKVIDHYENPRNVGAFDGADGEVGTGLGGQRRIKQARGKAADRPDRQGRRQDDEKDDPAQKAENPTGDIPWAGDGTGTRHGLRMKNQQ